MQSSVPLVGLYLPSTHATHAPPSGPVKPRSHLQSSTAELPPADTALEGHGRHALRLAEE